MNTQSEQRTDAEKARYAEFDLPERLAATRITDALEPLTEAERTRVIKWMFARFQGVDIPQLDDGTLVRWHVQLNGWVWPDDLPGRPLDPDHLRTAIRGAFAVVDLLASNRGLTADDGPIDRLWMDEPRRSALIR